MLTLAALSSTGCRANPDACADLAAQVAKLAEAEDKGGPGTQLTVESSCREDPPTRAYVECVMAATDLATLEGC